MKKNNTDSFYLNKNERIGIYLLMVLFATSTLLPWAYQKRTVKPVEFPYPADSTLSLQVEHQDSTLMAVESRLNHYSTHKDIPGTHHQSQALFPFDPNTISAQDALKLGISTRAFQNLQKYLSKGGKIRSKEQFGNIYGITGNLYESLKDYIKFPENNENMIFSKKESRKYRNQDINLATEDELAELPLIGEKLAIRIIKYRTRLGGFISTEQLKEVYGITDSTFDIIKPYIYRSKDIQQIDLKTTDLNILENHPYIGYKKAKLIMSYVSQHSQFQGIQDLYAIKGLDSIWINKIKPYLREDH